MTSFGSESALTPQQLRHHLIARVGLQLNQSTASLFHRPASTTSSASSPSAAAPATKQKFRPRILHFSYVLKPAKTSSPAASTTSTSSPAPSPARGHDDMSKFTASKARSWRLEGASGKHIIWQVTWGSSSSASNNRRSQRRRR